MLEIRDLNVSYGMMEVLHGISLKVEDKELVNAMNLWSDKRNKTSKPRSFADVLDLFMPHGPRGGGRPEGDAYSSDRTQELVESLRAQSKRLEEGEIL